MLISDWLMYFLSYCKQLFQDQCTVKVALFHITNDFVKWFQLFQITLQQRKKNSNAQWHKNDKCLHISLDGLVTIVQLK